MPHRAEMREFAERAVAAHGSLDEVIFLAGNGDSLLVFADGSVVPVLYQKHGYNIRREKYAFAVAALLRQDPFEFLRFGYIGTGSRHFGYFLEAAGFRDADVTGIEPPLRLRRDGTEVTGNGTTWADGSVTPTVRRWYQFWK